jgi:hypothetical protein
MFVEPSTTRATSSTSKYCEVVVGISRKFSAIDGQTVAYCILAAQFQLDDTRAGVCDVGGTLLLALLALLGIGVVFESTLSNIQSKELLEPRLLYLCLHRCRCCKCSGREQRNSAFHR